MLVDQGYNRLVNARFPLVGTSLWLATMYGLVSRLHLILPLVAISLWRPHRMGWQAGHTRRHWRLLLLLLVANCGLVGGYLLLSGNATPYSGDEWLLTEVVIVPLVEETMWRGAVFAVLLSAFGRIFSEGTATASTVWASGLAFGLLHSANALVGVPGVFVAIQVLNATIWGVVYGYARALTGSLYPPLLVAMVLPWPTPLHTWLIVGALTILVILLIPAVYLIDQLLRSRATQSIPAAT